jgi:hypothetical protein
VTWARLPAWQRRSDGSCGVGLSPEEARGANSDGTQDNFRRDIVGFFGGRRPEPISGD